MDSISSVTPADEVYLKDKMLRFSSISLDYMVFIEVGITDDEFVHVTLIDDPNYEEKAYL